jgi:hypothetical protein
VCVWVLFLPNILFILYNIYFIRFVFKISLFILVPVICNLFPKMGNTTFEIELTTTKVYCNFKWRSYLSTGYNCIRTKLDWTKVVQDKAYLSSGQHLNNHIYPMDRSCPLYRWFIQLITLSTVLNSRALIMSTNLFDLIKFIRLLCLYLF